MAEGRPGPDRTMLDDPGGRRMIRALILEASLSKLGFGIVAFALPLHARSLGMSVASIGLLISANIMVGAVLKPLVGPLADRFGLRQAAIVASIGRVVVFGLFLTGDPAMLWWAQGLRGVAKSLRDPAVNALVAEHGGKQRMATTFGWYGTAKSVAGSAGKALAGLMLGTVAGYGIVFLLGMAIAATTVIVLIRLAPTGRVEHDGVPPLERSPTAPPAVQSDDRLQPGLNRRLATELAPWLVFGGAVSATSRMLRGLLPLLAVEYAGLNEAAAGSLYLVSTTVMSLAGPAFGRLSDRSSRHLVLGIRSVANVASSFVFLLFPSYGGFVTGKTVDTIGNAAFTPAWGAVMADVANLHPQHRARIMALMTSARDVGTVVGPIVGGLLWVVVGPMGLLVTRAILAAGTEVIAITTANRKTGH